MCRVLKVARAGFYVWLHRPVSAGEKDAARFLVYNAVKYQRPADKYILIRVIAGFTAIFVKSVKYAAETVLPES